MNGISLLRRVSGLRAAGIAAGAAAMWVGLAPSALGACKIMVVGEFNVSTAHNRVITQGQIDGKPIRVAIDTGSAITWVWSDSARRLGVPVTSGGQLRIFGVGGEVQQSQTIVKRLQIGTMYGKDMHLIVLGANPNRRADGPDLVLGGDMFAQLDTEFDLAHGKIRLLRPKGCTVDELPYWTNTYSQADLLPGDLLHSTIRTRVMVNGKVIEADLDSGAPTSAITRRASELAGVTPWVQDPHPAGRIHGIGATPVDSWVGTFDSFSIGDETIRHVPLRIADLFAADKVVHLGSRIPQDVVGLPTMLIGCDFFLAHHLLVLRRQGKLLFTYNGGTVFQIPRSGPPPGPAPGSVPARSPAP